LAAGIEKGEQIIKDATFARINLRLDVSQILKSAYQISLNQLR